MALIHKKGLHNPAQILVLSYISLILIGTILLKCPFSTKEPISWLTALFTSTSATTVTGLMTVFNGDVYSTVGNVIILVLVQLGGLGIMTFAVLIFVILDRPVSIGQKLMIQEALNQSSVGGIVALAKRLLVFSLFFEGFFAILLFIRFLPDLGFTHSLSYALFFSISAFNNAGISLWPDSLTRYEGDMTVNILVSVLVMVGGIGFTVMNDIWEKRRWRAFHLHTKLMLAGTLVINIFAVALIYFIEFDNPKTIGSLSAGEAFWGAFFQGIMTRSGGFNTVDIGGLEPATLFLMMILMFIGSGSVSTGGGIKLTTFICLWAMVIAFIRKKKVPILMKRTIHNYDIFKALTITLLSIGMIFAALFILLLTEKPELSFIHIAFEVVSAFGTTGLSAGVTPHLSVPGQLVMIVMMVFGKLGPLTILFSVAERSTDNIRYPTGKLFIG